MPGVALVNLCMFGVALVNLYRFGVALARAPRRGANSVEMVENWLGAALVNFYRLGAAPVKLCRLGVALSRKFDRNSRKLARRGTCKSVQARRGTRWHISAGRRSGCFCRK